MVGLVVVGAVLAVLVVGAAVVVVLVAAGLEAAGQAVEAVRRLPLCR